MKLLLNKIPQPFAKENKFHKKSSIFFYEIKNNQYCYTKDV